MKQATLALLIKDGQILLAMKKRGFGQGKWNGAGGKMKDGEKIEETAKRETFEEIGVEIIDFKEVARIIFTFKNNPEWSQEVFVYRVDTWEGEPIESEEMAPKWFGFGEIPYELMWPDDKYWLPKVIDGKKIKAEFLFEDNNEMSEEMKVEEIGETRAGVARPWPGCRPKVKIGRIGRKC